MSNLQKEKSRNARETNIQYINSNNQVHNYQMTEALASTSVYPSADATIVAAEHVETVN